jgi:hypothetical protein
MTPWGCWELFFDQLMGYFNPFSLKIQILLIIIVKFTYEMIINENINVAKIYL